MNFLKAALIVTILCTWSLVCSAQQAKDGVWLMQGVDAFNRVAEAAAKETPSRESDIAKAEVVLAYLDGVLAVHRQNSITASIIVVASQQGDSDGPLDEKAKVAFAFAPLLGVPDELPASQAIAILQKYLQANPGKWGNSANVIITQAFQAEFDRT